VKKALFLPSKATSSEEISVLLAFCTTALFIATFAVSLLSVLVFYCKGQIASCSGNMSAKQKNWSAVVTASAIVKDAEQFTRDTEVQVKLVTKPSRKYIYELLTKMRFPLMNVEAIIERRANIVDFTCKNRESAEKLVQLLHNHPNVREARLFESEFVDVKFTGVPHRLPDYLFSAIQATPSKNLHHPITKPCREDSYL